MFFDRKFWFILNLIVAGKNAIIVKQAEVAERSEFSDYFIGKTRRE